MKFVKNLFLLSILIASCWSVKIQVTDYSGPSTTGNSTDSTAATTTASTTASTTSSSTTTTDYDFNANCSNQKYKSDSGGTLEALCKSSTGVYKTFKFKLGWCMEYKDNQIKKNVVIGGNGMKKCNCIVMPKLVCNCKANGDVSGTSFPSIDLSQYLTIKNDQAFCKS
jgi:hypothetical protein